MHFRTALRYLSVLVYKTVMADFRIHGMTDELRRKLRIMAAEQDSNLNDVIIRILEEAVQKPAKK